MGRYTSTILPPENRHIVEREGMYYFKQRYLGRMYVISMRIRADGSKAAALAALNCRRLLETDLVNYFNDYPLHPCPKRFERVRQALMDRFEQVRHTEMKRFSRISAERARVAAEQLHGGQS